MSRKVTLVFVALTAVVAVSAVATTAAFAGWRIAGAELPANSKAALATKFTIIQNPKFESGILKIECTGVESPNAELIGTNRGQATLTFTGCAMLTEKCTLASTTLSTLPLLLTEITLDGALASQGAFVPETKSIFATFKLNGAECAVAGNQTISGKARFLAPEGQDERTDQVMLLFSAENELNSGLGEVKLHARAALLLASGKPWSYV